MPARRSYRAVPRNPLDVEVGSLSDLAREPDSQYRPCAEVPVSVPRRPGPLDSVLILEEIGDDGVRVVGASGILRRRFRVAGREVSTVVACDFAVDRAPVIAARTLSGALNLA